MLPDPQGWWPILAAAATCAMAYYFLYASLSCGDVSSVMPMMGSKVVFSGLLAHFMLGERHSGAIYIATLLVAISVAALSYAPSSGRRLRTVLKPAALMLACCMVFGVTDIYIKKSLAFVDAYSFMVYYNLLVAVGSLVAIPYLRAKGVALRVRRGDLGLVLLSSVFLVGATLLFVISFQLADGVVIPNILMSTRGVFIVILSAVASHHGSTALDVQGKGVYLLRFAASLLLIFSIWLALS